MPNKKLKVVATTIINDELTTTLFNSSLMMWGIMKMDSLHYIPLLYKLPAVVRDVHYRIPRFTDEWIGQYIEMDFYKLFRMTWMTYEKLNREIGKIKRIGYGHGRTAVPLEKCILMTLWYLGKGDTLLSIADRFNVSPSTAIDRIHFVIDGMVTLLPKFVIWPTEKECEAISIAFQRKCKYAGVIGANPDTLNGPYFFYVMIAYCLYVYNSIV